MAFEYEDETFDDPFLDSIANSAILTQPQPRIHDKDTISAVQGQPPKFQTAGQASEDTKLPSLASTGSSPTSSSSSSSPSRHRAQTSPHVHPTKQKQKRSSGIMVKLVGTPLIGVSGSKKRNQHRRYDFEFFELGSAQPFHAMRIRYSHLRERISRVSTAAFPGKGLIGDYTFNEALVAKRGEALRRYLELILNGDVKLHQHDTSTFHEVLELNPNAINIVQAAITASSPGLKDKSNHHDRSADYVIAQNFNRPRSSSTISDGSKSKISTINGILTFPYSQKFELRSKSWEQKNSHISGPGGNPWFAFKRLHPELGPDLVFKRCHFLITSIPGDPLIAIEETFSNRNYKSTVYRLEPGPVGIKDTAIAEIKRSWGMRDDPNKAAYAASIFASNSDPIQCIGSWPSNFALKAKGKSIAAIDKQHLGKFTWTEKYQVKITQNQDVMLVLGLICAIDRIHSAVQEAKAKLSANSA